MELININNVNNDYYDSIIIKNYKISNNNNQNIKYSFDKIFNNHADQDTINKYVSILIVNNFINGITCAIYSYGTTGSGKSYTMLGDL
jgi:hypothetical protein